MKSSEVLLKSINRILNFIVMVSLLVVGLFAAYALWDNNTVYAAAHDVQLEMMKIKPQLDAEDGHSFEELLKINKDVAAWVTVDNTNIDYPIVQGETNLTYVNTDVYGNFALAGTIFIDTRNNRDFTDTYSLLYGHDMAEGKMFGDIQLFKNESFFKSNRTGTLILPDRAYKLEIFSCILVNASDDKIFDPTVWQGDIQPLLDYAKSESLYLHDSIIDKVEQHNGEAQILALTTCTYEFTDARTVLLAYMVPIQ